MFAPVAHVKSKPGYTVNVQSPFIVSLDFLTHRTIRGSSQVKNATGQLVSQPCFNHWPPVSWCFFPLSKVPVGNVCDITLSLMSIIYFKVHNVHRQKPGQEDLEPTPSPESP